MSNPMHDANRRRWDAAAPGWARMHDRRGTWRNAHRRPDAVFDRRELELLKDAAGQRACVLGSGDNLAAFALAGLGARVTSVDISERQLEVARQRAAQLGLAIDFLRADVTDLSALATGAFDLVYTGGHVAVWVSDLRRYYAEAVRLLSRGGLLLITEYHPFRRIWADRLDRLERAWGYFDRAPRYFEVSAELFDDATPGTLPSYEFQWTVADHVNAALDPGCELVCLDEFNDAAEGWERAPLAGLPLWLLIAARKR